MNESIRPHSPVSSEALVFGALLNGALECFLHPELGKELSISSSCPSTASIFCPVWTPESPGAL